MKNENLEARLYWLVGGIAKISILDIVVMTGD